MSEVQRKHLQIKSSKLMNSLFVGNFKAAFSGKGVEFQDFREYSPEDDAKYIDWLTSSREGNIVMRRYREEKEGNILCVLDITDSLFFQWEIKVGILRDVLSLISEATLSSGEAFGGYVISPQRWLYVPPQKNIGSLHKLLKEIPRVVPREYDSLLSFEELYKKRGKKSIIFIISDSVNISEKSFSTAAIKHDIIYIHLSTHFENTLTGEGVQRLRGTTGSLAVDLTDDTGKKRYREIRQKQLDDFGKTIHRLGGDIVFLDENTSLYSEFLKLMKRREK